MSSEKPTEQRVLALLNVSNIPIQDISRNFDQICIKMLNIKKFLSDSLLLTIFDLFLSQQIFQSMKRS